MIPCQISTGESIEETIGHYNQIVSRYPLLTRAQEFSLASRAQKGDTAALETMVLSNIRLVILIARRHTGRGVPLGDLVQEGVIGLIRAAEKFDPARGYRFTTYAYKWIAQAVARAVPESGYSVRVPYEAHVRLARIQWAELRLHDGSDHLPDIQDVADLSRSNIADVGRYRVSPVRAISLSTPILDTDDNVVTLEELIPDPQANHESRVVLRSYLDAALDRLTPVEETIIRQHFGLGQDAKTLNDIGASVGLCRERVRQILFRALAKLRSMLSEGEATV